MIAFIAGALLNMVLKKFSQRKTSKFITNIFGSALVTLVSLITFSIGLPVLYDKIIIGAIMPLVPGIALTTSIRDFFNGDYLSGAIHMIDAVLTAFCMIATLSFAVLFCAPKSELLFCGLTGAIGWIVYLICLQFDTGTVIANMIATLALTVFSRVVAALRKNPVTVYLIAGIFPLVPGAGIYYTSYYFIMNDMSEFSRYGMETIKVAGAIVLGIIFGFSLPQAWFNALQHRTKRQSSHA